MTWKNGLIILIYFALFAGAVAALIFQQRRRRKLRLPFGEDMKLLRSPGETQLKLVRKLEEDAIIWVFCAATVPVAVAGLLLWVTTQLPATFQIIGAVITLAAVGCTFYASAKWFAGRTGEIGNRYLGYFGERVVGEHLEPLKALGWRIFHDVPGMNNGNSFNLDHVAVGPAGVFVVETKTRRKGGARPGFDDHKVYFDGHSLVWPWGEDNHGLEQTERNAVWLADTLLTEVGEHVPVTPVLTLPGWWVEMKPARDSRQCRVTNPKTLAKFLPSGPGYLSSSQIAAIAAKLEARCRDVEY